MNTFFTALVLGFGFSCGIALFVYIALMWETRNLKKQEVKIHYPYEVRPNEMIIDRDLRVRGNINVTGNVISDGYFAGMTGGSKSLTNEDEDIRG